MPKPHTRYGFWTFGWIEAERQIARAHAFNERWEQLIKIRELIYDDFVVPALSNPLTPTENAKLCEYGTDMAEWQALINNDIETANQHDLNKFATSIKKTALKAIKLCIKYKNYDNLTSVNYNAQTKTIQINGKDYYYLGNGQTPPKTQTSSIQRRTNNNHHQQEKEEDKYQIWVGVILVSCLLLDHRNAYELMKRLFR